MNKKLYVGNLAFAVTEDSLKNLFARYGTVETCNLITDHSTGHSKGFAFVEMSTGEEAEGAVKALNQSDFEGRALTVNEAKPRGSGGGSPRSHRDEGYGGKQRRGY